MRTPACVIPGILHKSNKGSTDWGWGSNLLAYGCQSSVVVLDPKSLQTIQVLERYKSPIVAVKWARENYHHDLSNPYALTLAAADAQGRILIWDVLQGSVKAEFSDTASSSTSSVPPVTDLHWLASVQDASHDLLVALHPPYSVILWNADSGAKIWKKNYSDPLTRFAFDPYDPANVTFLVPDGILFVTDFSINRCPPSNGQKFYISTNSSSANAGVGTGGSGSLDRKRKESSLRSKMRMLVIGESESIAGLEDVVLPNECLQLVYHRAVRRHLLLVYPKEILIMDLAIKQTVGVIQLERGGSSFSRIIPCRQSDVIFCLHETGVISLRARQCDQSAKTLHFLKDDASAEIDLSIEMTYDTLCYSDPLRLTRHLEVSGFGCSPISENSLALVLSDGRTIIWNVMIGYDDDVQAENGVDWPQVPYPGRLPFTSNITSPEHSIRHQFSRVSKCLARYEPGSKSEGPRPQLQMLMTGLHPGLASPVGAGGNSNAQATCVLKMCPPLTTKNIDSYQPLLAIGTRTGCVQIYNLSTGIQACQFSLHTYAVKGIEWVNLHAFISFCVVVPPSYGSSSSAAAQPIKNELSLVDISTGRVSPVKLTEDAPVEMVRISYLKQYFILVYKGRPFELWDLKSLTILRQMPKSCPAVSALEWSPSHSLKHMKKKSGVDLMPSVSFGVSGSFSPPQTGAGSTPSMWPITGAMNENGNIPSSHSPGQVRSTTNPSNAPTAISTPNAKEHFVFVDNDGLLYHFVVEGNVIKDGSKISPDGGLGSITSIAWKGETMVLGDVDGNLNIWDLKGRVSRSVPTHRGWIRKLKFAPGRGNMKLVVLFTDGVEIWDTKEVQQCSSLKSPKDGPKTLDVDWASSDKPILGCLDGCIRVTDISMRVSCSPFEDSGLSQPVFVPHLLPSRLSIFLKSFLENQLWRCSPEYSFDLSHLVSDSAHEPVDLVMDPAALKTIQQQVNSIDPELKSYLPHCQFGTAERCGLVAHLFGDESAILFWQVALHFALAKVAKDANLERTSLPLSFDILLENKSYKDYQLRRLSLQDARASTYDQVSQCTENCIYLGLTDRAVQLLLETEPSNSKHYTDALRACLVATTRSDGASQSTIKLVATSMIASGKIAEGCQLLCLIDKALDACRYLQTYGEWHQATWLAKSTLDATESSEVLRRYVDFLCSANVNLKSYAILVLLSLDQFTRAMELMLSMRQYDRAACFAEALIEFGIWQLPRAAENRPQTCQDGEESQESKLIQAAFLEYGRLLLSLGNVRGARHYNALAGGKEEGLKTDIQSVVDAYLASKLIKNSEEVT